MEIAVGYILVVYSLTGVESNMIQDTISYQYVAQYILAGLKNKRDCCGVLVE